MTRDVREYFKSCPVGDPRLAIQTGTQLARSGIVDMDALCALLSSEPQKLPGIRNIGPKSLALIYSVCEIYQRIGDL